jgi:hypothetical protein
MGVGKTEVGAINVKKEPLEGIEYRFLKINPHYHIGLALLARHVYSMDDGEDREKDKFPLPGFELLNGKDTASLLGISETDSNRTTDGNENIIYNFKGFKFSACGCVCKNTENITIRIKKDGGIVSCSIISEKTASVVGTTIGIASKLAIASYFPPMLFSDLDKNIKKAVERFNVLGTGFKAAIYKKTKPEYENEQPYKYFLVFAGSDLITDINHIITDWIKTNGGQGLGLFPTQYKQAALLALKLKANSNDHLIVGHSLGGGLASCAAVFSDTQATVFNPAGLHIDGAANYLYHTKEGNILGHSSVLTLVNKLNPVSNVIDYCNQKTIQDNIKKNKKIVTALCSKTDFLTGTQDNVIDNRNNAFMTLGGFVGKATHHVATGGVGAIFDAAKPDTAISSNMLKNAGKLTGFFVGAVFTKLIIHGTFGKKIDIETDKLNIPTPEKDFTGHSMEIMIDGLILQEHNINNNEEIAFYEKCNGVMPVFQRQWTLESSKVASMYKFEKDDYISPLGSVIKKIGEKVKPSSVSEFFGTGWEKNTNNKRHKVIVTHRTGKADRDEIL